MDYVRRWRGALSMLVRAACAVRNLDLGASARRLVDELGVDVATGADRLSVPGARCTELRGLPDVVADLADTLRAGRSVMVFPEGTTWCGGHGGGVFRRAALQAAIDADAPIRPVTFDGRQGEEPRTVAAFVGADTLLNSLHRVARARDLRVTVTVREPFSPEGDRRALTARAEAEVRRVAHV